MKRKPAPARPDLREPWQIAQGNACGCRGVDDYCVCQNVQRTPPTEGEDSRDGLEPLPSAPVML